MEKKLFQIVAILFCISLTGCELLRLIGIDPDKSTAVLELLPDGVIDPQEASDEFGLPIIQAHRGQLASAFVDSLNTSGADLENLEIQLLPDYNLKVKSPTIEKHSNYTLLKSGGGIEDDYLMSLVVSDEGMSGFVVTNGYSYKISPLDSNQLRVLKVDVGKMPLEDVETESAVVYDDWETTTNPLRARTDSLSPPHQHDLIVFITDKVNTNRTGVVGDIISSVDVANDAYTDSNIDLQLNLVATEIISHPNESIDASTELDRLKETNDGFIDDVHNLRDRYAADLVILLVLELDDACGKANLHVVSSDADDDSAFSVIDVDCLTSKPEVIAHELGHIAGAHHNTGNDPFPIPAYAHGWVRPNQFSSSRGWRSVMAYEAGGCDDVAGGCPRSPLRFSNPDITIGRGPIGNGRADNARRINETAQALAGFRITGPRISLYEGNNSSQDHVCVVQVVRDEAINFTTRPMSEIATTMKLALLHSLMCLLVEY